LRIRSRREGGREGRSNREEVRSKREAGRSNREEVKGKREG
jgi:hypothetical protein